MKNARHIIGAVPYLNARPLVEGLGARGSGTELVTDLPSRLANRLAAGELDAAIVPSVDLFRDPALSALPDICISSRGPVRSVKLFLRGPVSGLQTVGLDRSSHTSAALAGIILSMRYGCEPHFVPIDPRIEGWPGGLDGFLLIGDPALRASLPCDYSLDLGGEWTEMTGLPFVYAVWAARPGADIRYLTGILRRAKTAGLARLGSIARRAARLLGLGEAECESYLRHAIHYDFGPREKEGLDLFRRLRNEIERPARMIAVI